MQNCRLTAVLLAFIAALVFVPISWSAESVHGQTLPTAVVHPKFLRIAPEMTHHEAPSRNPRAAAPKATTPKLREPKTAFALQTPAERRADPGIQALAQESATGISRNFGGLLVAPSYVAVPGADTNDQSLVTVAADFNNDGRTDLATLDTYGNINVLINQGNAQFAAPVSTNAGKFTGTMVNFTAAIAVDVDGDNFPDIIATDKSDVNDVLYVFHNKHDGTFSLASTIPVIRSSQYCIGTFLVGDVTGDGVPDLVALSSVYDGMNSTITLQTFVGKAGGFDSAHEIQSSLTYANYDITIPNRGALLKTLGGKLQLVFEAQAYGSNTSPLAGVSVLALTVNGDGTFNTTPSAQIDFAPSYAYVADNSGGLALEDLNSDGVPDITLNFGDDYVYTALGNADGSFQAPIVAQAGFAINPSGWALVDVDGDGYLDFVDYDNFYTTVWPGKGDGTFANPRYIYSTTVSNTGVPLNFPGSNLAVGDFNGDGAPDLAIVDGGADFHYGRASIFIGNADGSFQAAPAVAPLDNRNIFPQSLAALVSVDLNGDGYTDVLMLEQMNFPPWPYLAALSDGKGHFTYKKAMSGNAGNLNLTRTFSTTADFNGDGLRDVIFGTLSGQFPHLVSSIAVALSRGDGTLKDPVAIAVGSLELSRGFSDLAVADINGDGKLDIVATYTGDRNNPAGFVYALGNGDGTFQSMQFVPYGNQVFALALADLDGDGNVDLVLADSGSRGDPSSANVAVIYGHGTGTFDPSKAQVVDSGHIVDLNILVSDLNGDGKADLVLLSRASTSTGQWDPAGEGALVYLNQGNRHFAISGHYEPGRMPCAGLIADFNGDGIPDLLFSEYLPSEATADFYGSQILLGNGDGTFGSPFTALIPVATAALLPGHYTDDGTIGIVGDSAYGAVIELLNQGGTTINLSASSTTITVGNTVYVTATVHATQPYRPVPTGTVTLSENGVQVGSGDLDAGVATIAVSGLPVGSHTLSVSYSGDGAFNVNSNAASIGVTVQAAPAIAPSLSIQASASSLTLKRGETGAVTLTITANSAYSGTVSFAASGVPNGASVVIAPTQVSLTPGQTTTATVTISTVSPKNMAAVASRRTGWLSGSGLVAFAGVMALVMPASRKRRRKWLTTICSLALLALGMGLLGCGSDSKYKVAGTGTSTIVIKATPSVAGVSNQAVNITVVVE